MRAIALAICVGLSVVAASAVKADTLHDSVRIDVTADIPGRCGFQDQSQSAQVAIGAVNVAGAQTLHSALHLDCNTPFAVGVRSTNGGMAFSGGEAPGFTTLRSYNVALSIGTNNGVFTTPECTSAQLHAAGLGCSFYGALPGQGQRFEDQYSVGRNSDLIVSWDQFPANSPRLPAGAYQDTLIVVVGPVT
jgi:hypothetical protein